MDLSNLQLMNAAGWCKDLATVRKLAKTPISEITVGSITREARPGNEGSIFWQSPDGTYALNSLGLPNPGIEKYREMLPEMHQIAKDSGKKLRVNIAGFSPVEYADLARVVALYADVIEINLGCPNVWGTSGQKPIASFDPELMKQILNRVCEVPETERSGVTLAAKVSPYSDPGQLEDTLEVLEYFSSDVKEIVTSNTFPNAFALDKGKQVITPGGGLAGMSGKAMKAIALGQVAQFREKLDSSFKITGVGGASCGADILDLVRAGADSVQIGTHYFVHGEKVFSEMLGEYATFF